LIRKKAGFFMKQSLKLLIFPARIVVMVIFLNMQGCQSSGSAWKRRPLEKPQSIEPAPILAYKKEAHKINFAAWLGAVEGNSRQSRRGLIRELSQTESIITRYLENSRHSLGLPRLTVGLFRNKTRLYSSEEGFDHNSIRPLASVSKIFTAVAIMQLYEQKRLRLEDNIARFLPGFKLAERPLGKIPITVADLMRHSSGIPYHGDGAHTLKTPVRQIRYGISSQFQPAGKASCYSNQNTYVLGAIIEQVTGISYPEYIARNILEPLGMTRSHVADRANAASGIYSSVNELHIFYRSLMHPGRDGVFLLRPSSLARMMERPAYEKDPGMTGGYWGLGLHLRYHEGNHLEIFHNGRWTDAGGRLSYFPAEDLYLIYLGKPDDYTNMAYRAFPDNLAFRVSKYARKLQDILAPDTLIRTTSATTPESGLDI
jgi:CubicO group peptidase (beta-lactamase class C family)